YRRLQRLDAGASRPVARSVVCRSPYFFAAVFAAVLRGRPPLAPLRRAAAAFAAERADPALAARCRSSQDLVPKSPASNPGTLASTSSRSQCRPRPMPSTFTSARSLSLAFASPWTQRAGKEKAQPL